MKKEFILLFLLFAGCLAEKKRDDLGIELRWLNAAEIIDQNLQLPESLVINKPEGTWQHLFSLKRVFDKDKFLLDCIFYRIPTEDEKGELKIKELGPGEKCDEFLLEKGDINIHDISSFSYYFKERTLSLRINESEKRFLFLSAPRKENTYSLFQSDKEHKKSEIRFQSLGGLHLRQKEVHLKKGDFCHRYANDCSEEQEYQCDQCEQGLFTQVINSSCQRGYSKICGDVSCGNLNEAACIRGFKASGVKDHCIQDGPVGFCHNDLRVRCVDGLLICSQ